jgi:2-phosphosulfolactate phosphatase
MIHIIGGLEGAAAAVEKHALAVMVDSLRASATLCAFFLAGAGEVLVCGDVETARLLARGEKNALLAGERKSLPPEGFHLGNSPVAAAATELDGKTVIFTSTNGAAILRACQGADGTVVGGITNADRIAGCAQWHLANGGDVVIIHAGDEGRESDEDLAAAVLLADVIGPDINPEQEALLNSWKYRITDAGLVELFGTSRHGRELLKLGFESDLEAAAQVNLYPVLPKVDGYFDFEGAIVVRLIADS